MDFENVGVKGPKISHSKHVYVESLKVFGMYQDKSLIFKMKIFNPINISH